jgi:hypothetical protein
MTAELHETSLKKSRGRPTGARAAKTLKLIDAMFDIAEAMQPIVPYADEKLDQPEHFSAVL